MKIHSLKVVDERAAGAVVAFVLTIPFIEPQMFKSDSLALVDSAYKALKIISASIIAVLYLRKKGRPSGFLWLVVGIQVWIGLATLLNQGSLSRFVGPAITAVSAVALTEYSLTVDLKKYLFLFRNLLTGFFVINVVTYILLQAGTYPFEYAFLGMDNRWFYFFLPWTVIAFLYDAIKGGSGSNRWTPWVIYGLSVGMLVMAWSVGAVIAMVLWLPLWLITAFISRRDTRFGWPCEVVAIWAGSLLANIALLSGGLLAVLQPILRRMQKDVTLSGRTFIWDGALTAIENNPLLGRGVQAEEIDGEYFYSFSPGLKWTRVNHPHNTFLNYAYHGGWPAGVGFIAMCSWALLRIWESGNGRTSRVLLCGLGTFIAAALVDTLDFGPLFQILSLAWLAPQVGAFGNPGPRHMRASSHLEDSAGIAS